MKFDQAQVWAEKISDYFGTGPYGSDLLNDLIAWIRNYSEESMAKLMLELKQTHKKSYKVDLSDLTAAARQLGLSRVATAEASVILKGERIACEICGHEYSYNRYSPASAFSGPVSSCPVCAWYQHWTLDWLEAGSPKPDGSNPIGKTYHKRVADWERNLDERKQLCRRAAHQDNLARPA